MSDRIILCGNNCGHNHEGINSPTGCCVEHGPFMYFCNVCHEARLATRPASEGGAGDA